MLKAWHYVGHQSMVAGARRLFPVRDRGRVRHRRARRAGRRSTRCMNVCRHRGSRICDADGRARGAIHLPLPRLDLRPRRLAQGEPRAWRRASTRRSSACAACTLTRARGPHLRELRRGRRRTSRCSSATMAPAVRPYGLDKAKVAHRQNYPIASNWKLAVENYCECYHCQPAHPEYSVGHGRAAAGRRVRLAMLAEVMAKAPVGRPHAGHDPALVAARAGLRPRARLRPLPAVARPADRQPRRQARRAAARHHHGLRRRHDRPAPWSDDLRACLLRPRRDLPLCAARPVPDGLRDHLAGQRVRGRGQGLPPRRPHLALGRNDDRRQVGSSSATRRASTRASTSRARSPRSMETFTQDFLDWYVAAMRRATRRRFARPAAGR